MTTLTNCGCGASIQQPPGSGPRRIRCVDCVKKVHRERSRLEMRQCCVLNPEKFRLRSSNWRKNNLEKVRIIRKRSRNKFNIFPTLRLAHNIRCRLYKALKKYKKFSSSEKLVGCSFSELKSHIESKFVFGMTWENYGPVWHVDHIKPCTSFDLSDPAQQRECFHFTNLQPLFAIDNLRKGAKH